MNRIVIPAALAAAIALAGCAAFVTASSQFSTGATNFATGMNTINTALSSPSVAQAATNLKTMASAVACGIGDISAIAKEIETDIDSKKVGINRTTGVIYTVSSDICTALGGSASKTATTGAAAAASTTAPTS
jgi:hypothetical protein